MAELHGELEAYWEQGWEGRIEWAFQFEGNWKPFFPKDGQHLTIYDESNNVLWAGRIKFVKRNNWFDNHKLVENPNRVIEAYVEHCEACSKICWVKFQSRSFAVR